MRANLDLVGGLQDALCMLKHVHPCEQFVVLDRFHPLGILTNVCLLFICVANAFSASVVARHAKPASSVV